MAVQAWARVASCSPRALMQSRVLMSTRGKASSAAVSSRSMGQEVPKAATAPSGFRLRRS